MPRNADVRRAVEDALDPDGCVPAGDAARHRLVGEWEGLRGQLAEDVRVRATQRVDALQRRLSLRADDEVRRVDAVFDQLAVMLSGALEGDGVRQLSFDDLEVNERQQWDRDRAAWQARLDELPAERAREREAVAARYAGLRELVFPFAVALVVAR